MGTIGPPYEIGHGDSLIFLTRFRIKFVLVREQCGFRATTAAASAAATTTAAAATAEWQELNVLGFDHQQFHIARHPSSVRPNAQHNISIARRRGFISAAYCEQFVPPVGEQSCRRRRGRHFARQLRNVGSIMRRYFIENLLNGNERPSQEDMRQAAHRAAESEIPYCRRLAELLPEQNEIDLLSSLISCEEDTVYRLLLLCFGKDSNEAFGQRLYKNLLLGVKQTLAV
ncbi:conserved hypothetical protein, partial [Trichinella spiralis]|uniref:hypothetical protein n=1 Tax=Trichinella spiralis TaxID=6334 RepID=UPI0001EFD6C1